MEQGRDGGKERKERTAGTPSFLSRLVQTLEDSVRQVNCCPLHQRNTNSEGQTIPQTNVMITCPYMKSQFTAKPEVIAFEAF